MAVSSPTSSASSSRSSPFTQSEFSSLPIMSLRKKIVEKVLENRVTLIVGETGCGKSSQVPQFLLEERLSPIICTQPRRFAVVAVAKTVAKARNCELGGEVGYHIGHSKVLSARTKIIFKTAGVLLDEMRDKGQKALHYKVIILDEVHERSLESDLVLVCLKQFLLKNNDLRLVLMSATADISRYRDYFKDLGRDERVEVLGIPSTNQRALFQTRVSYLDQVAEFLGISTELLADRYCSGRSPLMADAKMKPEVHKLIHDLVVRVHENEPDIEKGILVFLPTYQALKQQWDMLQPLKSSFKIHVLHSSIDIDQALTAMKIWQSHRKVILATNIAESSVTIPKVAYVIDSCRSLQVFWDTIRKKDSPELVWVSKSQAEQRKGRTGRTCDGQIYRLVTRSFFTDLDDYESPAILKLSLRLQVLQICCADSRAINDPKALLRKALDPPGAEIIEDALQLLTRINALERASARGRHEPTFYGRLLASFSLSFDASVLILKFGEIGLLREGILLGILMDMQPLPILHPFGEDHLFVEYACTYFAGSCNNEVKMGQREMTLMGNLSAYQFWQRIFKDKVHLEHLKQLLKFDEMEGSTLLLPKIEEEWCSFHNLVQSSLHQVAEKYEDILSSLHQFRPRFLGTCDGIPSYYYPYEFEHTCLLKSSTKKGGGHAVATDEDDGEPSLGNRKCFAVPFVDCGNFRTINVATSFSNVIKEIRIQYSEDTTSNQNGLVDYGGFHVNSGPSLCAYFANGSCTRGSLCNFSHSIEVNRATCRYFFTLQGCRNGNSCPFSHDSHPSVSSSPTPCMPEDGDASAATFLLLFTESSHGFLLLLDDTDLHFSSNLVRHYDPTKIISTTSMSDTSICDESLTEIRILWGLHHPFQTIISGGKDDSIRWGEVNCILWFPSLDSYSENLERQKILMQNFFEYLALRILADALYEVQVILTMNNIKFSQVQVEKLARENFFFLRRSFPFDEARFGKLSDDIPSRKQMLPSTAISYVFKLHPPSDIQFGDYAASLQKLLHSMQESC